MFLCCHLYFIHYYMSYLYLIIFSLESFRRDIAKMTLYFLSIISIIPKQINKRIIRSIISMFYKSFANTCRTSW